MMAVAESEETGMHKRHKRSVTIESSISLSDSRGEQQLRKQIKGTMIGVALDSPSDSWVPTHGATPSMPAFSGNPILLYVLLVNNVYLYKMTFKGGGEGVKYTLRPY